MSHLLDRAKAAMINIRDKFEKPPRFSETWDPPVILCPVCGFDYNHIGQVTVSQNCSVVRVGASDGQHLPLIEGFSQGGGGRGSTVAIRMSCESGHEWELVVKFHKGNTSLFCNSVIPEGSPEFDALWRD